MRVVLVDDSEDLREALRLALDRQADFTVVGEAADGQTGVTVTAEQQPDVVLLDIAMPDMDGLQALTAIRHESPDSTVIIMTGYPETVAAAAAVELGAHGFIRKGGNIATLLELIREIVQHHAESRSRRRKRNPPDDVPHDG
jgi:YesN/AraC family two-component response regulator